MSNNGDYYRISGDKTQEIIVLDDETKIKVTGLLFKKV
jgi:hypothetical protein